MDTETLGARLPARDVGGSLGHSPSLPLSQRKGPRLGISPAGFTSCWPGEKGGLEREGKENTNNLLPDRCKSSSLALALGGGALGPQSALPPGLSLKPASRALWGWHDSQNAAGRRDPGLWVAQIIPSPSSGFRLYSSQARVHTTPGELAGWNVFSLPHLAFRSTCESTTVGWKHSFPYLPRLGSLLLLAEERPLCLAGTGGPRGSQTLSTGSSYYGGKGMGVESDWIIAPGLVSYVILDELTYFSETQFPYLEIVWQCLMGLS